jgi:hypothetical protein
MSVILFVQRSATWDLSRNAFLGSYRRRVGVAELCLPENTALHPGIDREGFRWEIGIKARYQAVVTRLESGREILGAHFWLPIGEKPLSSSQKLYTSGAIFPYT